MLAFLQQPALLVLVIHVEATLLKYHTPVKERARVIMPHMMAVVSRVEYGMDVTITELVFKRLGKDGAISSEVRDCCKMK